MNIYYVYAYLRTDGTPYYVGKGCGNRAYDYNHTVKPPRDKSKIVFLAENLSEREAFDLEIASIAQHGRRDLGTGILHNRTNGGEGASGRKITEETRQKMSIANTGKTMSAESRSKIGNANRGKVLSDETRQKLSDARKGKPGKKQSPETIAKRFKHGNAHFKKPITLLNTETGEVYRFGSRVQAETELDIPHSVMTRIVKGMPTKRCYIAITE